MWKCLRSPLGVFNKIKKFLQKRDFLIKIPIIEVLEGLGGIICLGGTHFLVQSTHFTYPPSQINNWVII